MLPVLLACNFFHGNAYLRIEKVAHFAKVRFLLLFCGNKNVDTHKETICVYIYMCVCVVS
jgi:hypothetical protein